MLLPTYPLTVDLAAPTRDSPLVGATVVALLDRTETDASGYVIQRRIEATTDATGKAVLSLWPNTRGSGQSQYVLFAIDAADKTLFEVFLHMPAEAAEAADVSGPPIPSDIPLDKQLRADIQAIRAEIIHDRTEIDHDRDAIDQAAQQVHADTQATQQAQDEARTAAGQAADSADAARAANDAIQAIGGVEGPQGPAGESAYQIARDKGYGGTITQWLASLEGEPGPVGSKGEQGEPGPQGETGPQGEPGLAPDAYMAPPPTSGGPYVADASGAWVALSDYLHTPDDGDDQTPYEALALDELQDGRIFQRRNGKATIDLTGQADNRQTVQARVVESASDTIVVDWTTLAVANSRFSGRVVAPEGGWYNAVVRYADGSDKAHGSHVFGVGILIGIIGQSNVEHWGYGDWVPDDPTTGHPQIPHDRVRSFYDGQWSTFHDGANGDIAYANELHANLDKSVPVGVLNRAVGGSALLKGARSPTHMSKKGWWLDTSSDGNLGRFKNDVAAIGGALEQVIWMQGEREAKALHESGRSITAGQYGQGVHTLFGRIRDGVTNASDHKQLPILLGPIGYGDPQWYVAADWQAIRTVQKTVASEIPGVTLGPNIMDLPRRNGGHHTPAAYTLMGQRYARVSLAMMGEPAGYMNPAVAHVDASSDTQTLVHIQHAGGDDFTPVSGIRGFRVTTDAGRVPDVTADRADASTIRLTHATAGRRTVTYEYVDSESVADLFRDNAPAPMDLMFYDSGELDASDLHVSVDDLTTADTTPTLTGTISRPDAAVQVRVNALDSPTEPLTVSATDRTTIDTTPTLTGTVNRPDAVINLGASPVLTEPLHVTADNQITTDTRPVLTGQVSRPEATIRLGVEAVSTQPLRVMVNDQTTADPTPTLTGTVNRADAGIALTVDFSSDSTPSDPDPGDAKAFVVPAPVDDAIGTPADWATTTTLTNNAAGEDARLSATLAYKDQDNIPITATAKPGTRARAVDAYGTPTPVSIRHFADGGVCIENVYAGLLGDAVLTDVDLKHGNDTLWTQDLTVYSYTRTRPFWYDPPQPRTDYDPALLPNYGTGSENAQFKDHYTQDDPMAKGAIKSDLGGTGASTQLGLLPSWDAAYVTNPSQSNAVTMRTMNDGAAVWRHHVIDPRTNDIIAVSDYPHASFLYSMRDHPGNVIGHGYGSDKKHPEAAHWPAFGYAASVIFGTEFDIEECQMASLFNTRLFQNPGYTRNGGAGPLRWARIIQTRTYAWAIRSAAQASVIGGSMSSMYKDWAVDLCQQVIDYMASRPNRLPVSHGYVDRQSYFHNEGLAPWQEDYLAMALGFAAQLGVANAKQAIQYCGQFQTQRLTHVPCNIATIYVFRNRYKDSDGNWVYAKDWAEGIELTAEKSGDWFTTMINAAEDSQELADAWENGAFTSHQTRAGDLVNIPASPTGYPAWLQAAAAYCVDCGVKDADQAWQNISARQRADFSDNPKYNIVPRNQ